MFIVGSLTGVFVGRMKTDHSGMNEQIKQCFINMEWNTTAKEKSHTDKSESIQIK